MAFGRTTISSMELVSDVGNEKTTNSAIQNSGQMFSLENILLSLQQTYMKLYKTQKSKTDHCDTDNFMEREQPVILYPNHSVRQLGRNTKSWTSGDFMKMNEFYENSLGVMSCWLQEDLYPRKLMFLIFMFLIFMHNGFKYNIFHVSFHISYSKTNYPG